MRLANLIPDDGQGELYLVPTEHVTYRPHGNGRTRVSYVDTGVTVLVDKRPIAEVAAEISAALEDDGLTYGDGLAMGDSLAAERIRLLEARLLAALKALRAAESVTDSENLALPMEVHDVLYDPENVALLAKGQG